MGRELLAHLRKDFRLEWRSKDALNGTLFFALLVVVIFSFAFDPTAAESRAMAGGIVWVAVLFAAILALNSAWQRETRGGVLDAIRMTPASPGLLFLSKAVANFIFVSALELLLAPLFTAFYNLHPVGESALLFAILPLGTWAITVNGTFFAALSLRTRNRELMLPLLLFPLSVPAVLAAVESTAAVLTGETDPGLWLRVLIAYDVVFTTLSLLLFATVLGTE